jgi:hypothetical protein
MNTDPESDITQALKEPAGDETIVAPTCAGGRPVTDRLGERAIRALVRDSPSGAMQGVLAENYGIRLSSVKRLLRHYKESS